MTEPYYVNPADNMKVWSRLLHGIASEFGPESNTRYQLRDIARAIDRYASTLTATPEAPATQRPVWQLSPFNTLYLQTAFIDQRNGIFNVYALSTEHRPAGSFPTLAEAKAFGERLDADLRELGYGTDQPTGEPT